jgi:hypothetical protein
LFAKRSAPPLPTLALPKPNTTLSVGTEISGSLIAALSEELRRRHTHVIGGTGSGKSNLLEDWARQDITRGRGVCVIDPKGTHPDSLYQSLLIWLHDQGFANTGLVHIIDPNAKSHITGFNPLSKPTPETALSVVADAMLDAFSQAWGGENMNEKPTTQSVLTALFAALAETDLTIAEASLLLDPHDSDGIRESVLSRISDRYARSVIYELHRHAQDETSKRGFRERVQGPLNRINKFVRSETIRAMMGQTERALNFRSIMDDGHILLVNLGDGEQASAEDARLLGALVLRSLFLHANKRTNTLPFFIYADECHRYLSGDIPSILDEARSYGLSAILAHQRLGQLREAGQNFESAFRSCTAIKAVFSLASIEDGRDMAEEVLPLNLEQPVAALMRETVVGAKRTVLNGGSQSEQVSESEGNTVGNSSSLAQSATISTSESKTQSVGSSENRSESESTGTSRSRSAGRTTSETKSEADMHGSASGNGYGNASGSFNAYGVGSYDDFFGMLLLPSPILSRSKGDSSGSSKSTFSSSSSGSASGRSVGESHTDTETEGQNNSTTTGISHGTSKQDSIGTSRSKSAGETTTQGESQSHTSTRSHAKTFGNSWSESYESIFEKRATAVHSKDNVLHFGAKYLRGLPPGHMVLSDGKRAVDVIVPLIIRKQLPTAEFALIRERFLASSAYATPFDDAVKKVNRREELLKATSIIRDADDEPTTFRVRSRNGANGRDKSRRVGNGHDPEQD